jgi:hypothetical protein
MLYYGTTVVYAVRRWPKPYAAHTCTEDRFLRHEIFTTIEETRYEIWE